MMIKPRYILNQNEISLLGTGWRKTKAFENKIVKNARGQCFTLISKYEKPLPWNNPKKIGKIILGCFASLFSLGLIPLFSKKVRKLFIPRKIAYEGELLPSDALKPSEKTQQNGLVKPIIPQPRKLIEPVAISTKLSIERQVDQVASDLQVVKPTEVTPDLLETPLAQINPIVPHHRKTLEPEADSSAEDLPVVSQEDQIAKPVEYTRAFFETRFERKNKTLTKETLNLFKAQATQLLDVLKRYECNKHDNNIHIRSLKRPLSPSELDAKKCDLAFKTMLLFYKTSKGDLPVAYYKHGKYCEAPHVRLIGFCKGMKRVLLQEDKKQEAVSLLAFKALDSGSFNDVTRVYSLTHQKDFVLRTLRNSSTEKIQIKWDAELATHQLFMKKTPHVVPLIGIINQKSSTGEIEKSCLLESCDTDLRTDNALRALKIKSEKASSKIKSERTSPVIKPVRTSPVIKPVRTSPEIHQMAYDLIAAIALIHESGYLYGDLKTENILLKNSNGLQKLHLADFGFSRPFTEFSTLVGTLELLPYEALSLTSQDGEKGLFCKSIDTWGLGFMCYAIAYGEKDLGSLTGDIEELFKQFNSSKEVHQTVSEFLDINDGLQEEYSKHLPSLETPFTELQVYQIIMEKHFKPLIEQEVASIIDSLSETDPLYTPGDPLRSPDYDTMIKGFLNMNMKERWTAADALQFMKDKNLVQKK